MGRALVIAAAVCVFSVFAVPTVAHAQAKAGDKELLISGNIFQTVGGDVGLTSGNALAGVGYFVTDRLQVAVSPILSITSTSFGGDRDVDFGLGLSGKVVRFFGQADAKVKPYAGASAIIQDVAELGDSLYGAINVGVKNYLSEKAALDMNGSYGLNLTSPGGSQLLQFTIGLSYIF